MRSLNFLFAGRFTRALGIWAVAAVLLALLPGLAAAAPLGVNLCGRVVSFSPPTDTINGSINLGGQTYTIVPGTLVADPRLVPGANVCLSATLNNNGQIEGTASILPSPAQSGVPAAGGGVPTALPNAGDSLPWPAPLAMLGGGLILLGVRLRHQRAA